MTAAVTNVDPSDYRQGEIIQSTVARGQGVKKVAFGGAESVSAPIYKEGFGLTGIQWAASAGRTFTFNVSFDGLTFVPLSSVAAVDAAVANGLGFGELAEWPWFEIVGDGVLIGDWGVVLS